MRQKGIISVILAAVLIISMFAACTAQVTPSGGKQATEETTVPAVVAAEDEIIKFSVKDSSENTLELVPLFDKDRETIIGGYILSGSDSSGNALTEEEYPDLGSFVKTQTDENNNFSLVYDEEKKPFVYDVYADAEGNMVAFEDTYDIDGNGNKEECFEILTLTDSNGVTFYCLAANENGDGYKIVNIIKDDDGLYFIKLEDGTTTAISKVNANNNAAKEKVSEQVSKNEEKTKPSKPPSAGSSSASTGNTGSTGGTGGNTGGSTTPSAGSGSAGGSTGGKGDTGGEDKEEELPTDSAIRITLDKNSGATIKNDTKKQVSIKSGILTINGSGAFIIDQSTNEWHGQIVVKMAATDESEIRFENVKIINEQANTVLFIDNTDMSVNNSDTQEVEGSMPDGPTQDQIKELSKSYDGPSPNLDISFPTGTESTFSASGSDVKGVIYNESKLTIKGNGVCNIEHKNNSNCAINSVKSIKIKNVELNLKTPVNMEGSRGIYSISTVTVESGKLNAATGGDCIRCDDYVQEAGTVILNSNKADGIDASDSIIINGGDLTVTALTKSSLKVRAMNQLKDGTKQFLKDNETFLINGGKIIAMGYKVSEVHTDSKQASISAKTNTNKTSATYNYQFTLYYKNPDDSNTVIYETPIAVRRFFYSDSSIDSTKIGRPFNGTNSKVECYKVKAGGDNKVVSFIRNVGTAEIKITQ